MNHIVLKIGTNVLMSSTDTCTPEVLECYAHEAQKLQEEGFAPLIVTSGAVQMGRGIMGNLPDKKTLSAVGQIHLVAAYTQALERCHLKSAQLLVSRHDLHRRPLFAAFQNTLETLCTKGIIPLINENDALTNGEPEAFGDNDLLAAIVAVAISATHLVYLTDQFGLYTSDPGAASSQRHLVCDTRDVAKEFFQYCSRAESPGGTGGMISKLKGAQLAIAAGVETYIANGKVCVSAFDLIHCRIPATRFHPKRAGTDVSAHDRWMLATRAATGSVMVDDGAAQALKNGKTLLAVGIQKVIGVFHAGDIIEVVDRDKHAVGCGASHIDSMALEERIDKGALKDVDVIHRDHLIMY